MKPAPFDYAAPESLEEALGLLAKHGSDARILAGGQSLIPMMNFRQARPAVLVDINKISGLGYIETNANGEVRVGTMARHYQVETDTIIAESAPLIAAAMPKIGTHQIRSRGTFGGSLALAHPSAELPSLSVALDGRFRLQSLRGERWVPASDFFRGKFKTALEPDEMIVEIALPNMPAATGWGFEEVARRGNDLALVGVCATASLDPTGACEAARLVFFSVGDHPMDTAGAVANIIGQVPDDANIAAVAEAATREMEPSSNIHATAEYRLHLARVLAKRALSAAFARAAGNS